jgi:hypothetical protein
VPIGAIHQRVIQLCIAILQEWCLRCSSPTDTLNSVQLTQRLQ